MSGETRSPPARRTESLLVRGRNGSSRWEIAVGAFALIGTFGLIAGPLGVLAALVTALVWSVVGTPYAVAVGHVLLVALFPAVDPVSFAIAEAGLLVLVVAPAVSADAPRRLVAGTIAVVPVLGGVTWLAVRSQPLWLAAAVGGGTIAVASYALHRYGLVTLGLVDDADRSRYGDDE